MAILIKNPHQIKVRVFTFERKNLMYRRYEDPFALECQLEELRADYEYAKMQFELGFGPEPNHEEFCLAIEELKDRIRFAWDDDENG